MDDTIVTSKPATDKTKEIELSDLWELLEAHDDLLRDHCERTGIVLDELRKDIEGLVRISWLLNWYERFRRCVNDFNAAFSPCSKELKRITKEGKKARDLNVSDIAEAWDKCQGPFGELIHYVKKLAEREDQIAAGEGREDISNRIKDSIRGAQELVQGLEPGYRKIRGSLDASNFGDLRDAIASLDSGIHSSSSYAERGIELIIGDMGRITEHLEKVLEVMRKRVDEGKKQ